MERWRKIQILQGEDPSQMYPESLIADDVYLKFRLFINYFILITKMI